MIYYTSIPLQGKRFLSNNNNNNNNKLHTIKAIFFKIKVEIM